VPAHTHIETAISWMSRIIKRGETLEKVHQAVTA